MRTFGPISWMRVAERMKRSWLTGNPTVAVVGALLATLMVVACGPAPNATDASSATTTTRPQPVAGAACTPDEWGGTDPSGLELDCRVCGRSLAAVGHARSRTGGHRTALRR